MLSYMLICLTFYYNTSKTKTFLDDSNEVNSQT